MVRLPLLVKRAVVQLAPRILPGSCTGYVDVCATHVIGGWAADLERLDDPLFVDIHINGQCIASVRASLPRPDVAAALGGAGRCGFLFNPRDYLVPGVNAISVRFGGSAAALRGGEASIALDAPPEQGLAEPNPEHALALSQERWRGDETDEGLTWGAPMTGDSFVDQVQAGFAFGADTRVVEIGPGYGRLLKTLRERQLPYRGYTGIELSAARVQRLNAQLGDERTRFRQGDILADAGGGPYDLAICSSTFEHLFPDCSAALANLFRALRSGGKAFIDFIMVDDEMKWEGRSFELGRGNAYVRTYSAHELRSLFAKAGFTATQIVAIVLGRDVHGRAVRRILVSAEKGPALPWWRRMLPAYLFRSVSI